MQNKVRYSIIIPHYNTPNLLQRCLVSIPEREDIQVIVVDDNSSTDIVNFATFPGLNRENVQCLFTKEGKGAGYARNMALPYAQGDWLIFADADDYFLPDAFSLFDKHSTSNADIIYFASESRFSDTGEPTNRQAHLMPLLKAFDANSEDSVNLLKYNYLEPWGKMIRTALIAEYHILFDEVRWANDVMFSTQVGYYARNIEVCMDTVYCITVAKGSLVHQRGVDSRRCRYEVMLRTNQFLRSVGMGKYEHSIMYSLRRAAKYGPKTLWKFIQLGRRYDAHFFTGANHWLRNAYMSVFHNEDNGKQPYIINDK